MRNAREFDAVRDSTLPPSPAAPPSSDKRDAGRAPHPSSVAQPRPPKHSSTAVQAQTSLLESPSAFHMRACSLASQPSRRPPPRRCGPPARAGQPAAGSPRAGPAPRCARCCWACCAASLLVLHLHVAAALAALLGVLQHGGRPAQRAACSAGWWGGGGSAAAGGCTCYVVPKGRSTTQSTLRPPPTWRHQISAMSPHRPSDLPPRQASPARPPPRPGPRAKVPTLQHQPPTHIPTNPPPTHCPSAPACPRSRA